MLHFFHDNIFTGEEVVRGGGKKRTPRDTIPHPKLFSRGVVLRGARGQGGLCGK